MSLETVEGFTGVERRDGSVGTRDHVLVLPSVICSHVVADRIAERVPAAVSTPHDHGCAQIGADNEQTRRTFLGLARNPNVAGTLLVGLGCEAIQSDEVEAALREAVPVREVSIQSAGGTEACLENGVDLATELASTAESSERPAGLGDLTVGVVSSDLDPSTVRQADPLVGTLVDDVVEAGGRVVVAGSERLTAHPDDAFALVDRTEAEADVTSLLARHEGQPSRASRVAREAAELDLETATAAWGETPVAEVLRYGERASADSGVSVVDAPSSFAEAATGLAAAGANLVVHVTSDGIPTGHPLVPVLKVSGNTTTVDALPDDIDVDATAASPAELRSRVLRVADGARCCAEEHGVSEFAITRVGPSM